MDIARAAEPAGADKSDQVKVAEIAVVRAGQAPGSGMVIGQGPNGASAGVNEKTAAATSLPRETPIPREAPVLAAPQPSAPSSLVQAPATLTPSQPSPVMTPSLAPERALRAGPVSVFVSRKERKVFVRKGFEPLFDMPVTIKDVDQPIGTHVFTALAQNDDGETMRWNVVTVPNTLRGDRRAEEPVRFAARKKPADKEVMIDAPPPPQSPDAAKAALDRIEMPADAVTRISQLMSAGASLIITDEGLGPETGQETDFVVLTRDGARAEAPKKPRRRSEFFD
jgi:hypothetical protein